MGPSLEGVGESVAKPVRVSLVVPSLEVGGGVPAVARFLYKVLSRYAGFEVTPISLATSWRDRLSSHAFLPSTWLRGPRVEEVSWDGTTLLRVGAAFSEFEFQRYRPRKVLTKMLWGSDFIQVVAGTPAWALPSLQAGRPVVLQVATLARLERASMLARSMGPKGLWRRAMTAITAKLDVAGLRGAYRVFVENHNMERLASELIGTRVIFAPPGVDTTLFTAKSYETDGYILSVGRLADPRKNLRLLLTAYASVVAAYRKVPPLVLVSKVRPTQADLSHACKLGIMNRLRIHVAVSAQELVGLYRGASLFVLSSDEEGLGLVLLEAMACGLPVISTRCIGPETVVEDGVTGVLTPVGDAQALADAIAQLLSSPALRSEMGRRGQELVHTRFSGEVAAQPYLRVYRQIVGL